MNLYKCKECGEEFDTDRGLHAHLKKHKITTQEYYEKHFPRFDLHTHKPIIFKTVKQYMSSDFNSVSNFRRWCHHGNQAEVQQYLVDKMKNKIVEKGLASVMGEVHLRSYGWPSVSDIQRIFKSYSDFCQRVGYPQQYSYGLTQKFYKDYTNVEILVDTREQKPLNFINPTKMLKLDCGDYTVGGDNFSNTFVDRKSAADFIGTMSRDLERFKREVERCASVGGYLFVVVDATMDGVARELAFSRSQANIHHIWHNMREILNEYGSDCQFVFSGGRTNSALLVPKILMCGKDLWRTDIQFHLNNLDDTWLGK